MALQSLDIQARSATTTAVPGVRETLDVAKLIDISKCIGCKACQVACMQWNDLQSEIGHNHGEYQNPRDLNDTTWTLMRFYDVEPAWARPGQALFSEAQARALWDFVHGLPRHVDTLYVHCR